MKHTCKKIWALVLALLLVCQIGAPAPKAALDGVYFTAVNNQLLPLNDETMPFWYNSELYVSQAIFAGGYLDVSCNINRHKQVITMYTLRQTLVFDLNTGECSDLQNNYYNVKVITRGSYYFFPLSLITSVFNLTWSFKVTDWVPLIRIKSSSNILSDALFLDAGAGAMEQYYNNYVKSITPSEDTSSTVTPPAPSTSENGKRVYLLMDLTDLSAAASALDTLSQYSKQATFIMTAQQMQENQDLLRRLVAQGHAIAIAPQSSSRGELVEELAAANGALWQAACAKTRLVYLTDAQSGLQGTVEQLGYTVCTVDVDYSDYPLTGSSRATNLYSRLTARSGSDITVYLGAESENLGGLAALLRRLQTGDCPVLAYRETLSAS